MLTFFASIQQNYAQTKDTINYKFSMLPAKKLIPVFTADARAHRLSVQRPFDKNSFIGSMGGSFPIAQMNKNKKSLQLCVAGTTYLELFRYFNHGSVNNIDFFVDVYLDAKLSDHFYARLGTGHTSQHLSDDAILKGAAFANYARDYHQLFGVYKNNKFRFFTYCGVQFNYNFKTDPGLNISNTSIIQFGFEHTPFKLSTSQAIFYAADIKLHGELNYRSTQHVQLGYRYQKNGLRALQIAYNYSAGVDERGQYYKMNSYFSSVGIYIDF